MKDEKFSEALTEVDDRYIEETLSYKPHKIRRRIVKLAAAAACFAFLFNWYTTYMEMHGRNWQTFQPIPDWDWDGTHTPQDEPVSRPTPVESPTEEQKHALLYSQLVKPHNVNTELLKQYEGSFMSIDIDTLHCEDMKECPAVIEGTILEMHTKTYNFTTHFDKFEPDGILNNRRDTVVYTIAVEKVWKGDFREGDIVIVEDDFFFCDSVLSICEGNTFVIPLVEYGDTVMTVEEPIEGDLTRESVYSSWNLFYPQIEKAEGGYIAADCWEPLTDDCQQVEMDGEIMDDNDPYFFGMYYIPNDLFEERFNALIS